MQASNDSGPVVPPSGEQTFLGHPRGLFLLFMVEMWERFSYYGMRGLLILYLVSVISVRQTPTGTYTNTLVITQTEQVDDPANPGKKKDVKTESTRELVVVVNSDAPANLPDAAPAPLAVNVQRMKPTGPAVGDKPAPLGADAAANLSPFVVIVKDGKPNVEELHYHLSNPTNKKIKVTAQLRRTENAPGAAVATPTYFTINDSSDVVSFDLKPDAERKADDEIAEFIIKPYTGDSGRNWEDGEAGTLYGWYTGMAYLLPILGGLLADKLIGTHRSMLVGGVLISIGHIVLGFSGFGEMSHNATGMGVFIFGLAVITIGTGHFKPSVSVMVGQLYPAGDPRRESAFSIFYMGINLGAFLCNIICGLLAAKYGWHYGFGAAAVGMIAGLCMYAFLRPHFLPNVGLPPTDAGGRKAWIFLPLGLVGAAVVAVAFSSGLLRPIDTFFNQPIMIALVVLGAIAYGLYFIFGQEKQDRGPVATIFVYMLFNAIFWLAFEQAGSSLNLFTDRYTNRDSSFLGPIGEWLFGNPVPTPYFQSINALLIIILAPIFGVLWAKLAAKNKNIPQPVKIGTGLIFVGLGYVVMVMAAMQLNSGLLKVGMGYIASLYFLHTVGEIILSPTGLSYVAKTAPKRHMSSLMGIWFISSFIAGKLSGQLSGLVGPIINGDVKLPWRIGGQADFFLLFVITSCAAGLLVIALSPILTRLQRNPKD